MRDKDYQTSADFLKRLFGETLQAVELRACPNERGAAAASSIFTRDEATVQSFCRRKDDDGFGLYFGACTRVTGAASGNKETVAECPALWVDIDCVKQGLAGADVIAALEYLPCPPTIIVNSGGGLHAWWVLEEALDVSAGEKANRDAVEITLRKMAGRLAGDTTVAELARIMRLPGTHNTKPEVKALNDGAPHRVEVLCDTQRVYDFGALVEWIDGQQVVLRGQAPAKVAAAAAPLDPYLQHAMEAGFAPSVDIDADLAAMAHRGNDQAAIHPTQLRVTAAMIARGFDDETIVEKVLAATMACEPRGERWDAAREEREIRGMIATGRAKGLGQKSQISAGSSTKSAAEEIGRQTVNGGTAVVHDFAAEKAKRVKKDADEEANTNLVAVGRAVLGVWQDTHGPLMLADGQVYAYEAGVWIEWCERLEQRLRVMIQAACASMKIAPTTSLLNGAYRYIMERPELHRAGVEFDTHGLLVAEDGALDLKTMERVPHAPEHYARFKVAARLDGARDCWAWQEFLAGSFADRDVSERGAIIAMLQEWFGAALIAAKPRALRKGLIIHGPSRTGKTQISEVMRSILGRRFTSGSQARDLEGRFGLEPFLSMRGWISDDAVGESDTLDAEIYKKLATGERASVQCKGGKNVEVEFAIVVLLTANALPKVKDQSDAVYNRSLIIPMTNVRPETEPEPEGFDSIAAKIVAEELTGVLWWAIDGWQRAAARGRFDPPKIMVDANRSFQSANNRVGSWFAECVEAAPDTRVWKNDLRASFNGWMMQQFGDTDRELSGRWFIPKLRPLLADEHEHTDDQGNRSFVGLRLNALGLAAWRQYKSSRFAETAALSAEDHLVNRLHDELAPPTGRQPRF